LNSWYISVIVVDGIEVICWSENDGSLAPGSFLPSPLLALQKLVKLCRPEKKQRGWCQRRKHADLRDKDRAHRKPMQKIASGDSPENRCRRRLPNPILAPLISLMDALLRIA